MCLRHPKYYAMANVQAKTHAWQQNPGKQKQIKVAINSRDCEHDHARQRAERNQDTLRRLDAFEIPKPAAKIHRVNETAASEHGAAHATANAKQRYPASGKFARSAVPQETTNRVGDHEKSQGDH